jgi:hypothetical protein
VDRSVRNRVLALALLCALGLLMELPASHAPGHVEIASAVAWAHGARPLELQAASAAHQPAHDPASCPICRSLHAKPVLSPPATREHLQTEQARILPAPAPLAHASPAREGHGPRAPPHAALTLA